MKQYAKLIEGKLHLCSPRHISNPSAEILESYALAHDYKQYISKSAPHHLCTHSYKETAKQITDVWTEISLEDAQSQQRALIIGSCNHAYSEVMAIYSQAEILVAQQNSNDTLTIMANARRLPVEQQTEELNQALSRGKIINATLAGYSLRLEDSIKAATSIAEVAAINWDGNEFDTLIESITQTE